MYALIRRVSSIHENPITNIIDLDIKLPVAFSSIVSNNYE